MSLSRFRNLASAFSAAVCLLIGSVACPSFAQSSSSQQSSSSSQPVQEKNPTIVDPAGPTISLIPSPQLFFMAAALNACGYDEGLNDSAPVRKRVREEMNAALVKSEGARAKRDKLCLYIAQHRMTGSERDISQYVSLALYLSPPPALETTVELPEMPPDATQVVEIVPLLKDFAQAIDLNGIWLSVRRTYDEETNSLHDPLSKMIVSTNLYLKMPASTYVDRRFVVVLEPMLSSKMVNARIYGTDYVVVLSPVNGTIDMENVRHVYLHYTIEPLLYSRTNAIDRMQPIMKEVREAPLEFRYRSETVPLVVECLIKAIEARTMNTGIADYKIPTGVDRSELPRYERERIVTQQKQEAVRVAAVQHDMKQGFVLTQYFFEQLIQFEKNAASLRDTIGEMVYGMDVEQQVHRARQTEFDQKADEDVLRQSKPRTLTGLDLAEAKLAAGDMASASAIAHKVLAGKTDTLESVAQEARANFILARVAIATGKPEEAIDDFQKTIATSKEPRLIAWSHIYLGRMLDLECKRPEAISEYQLALAARDGQQDTRLAAERGVKVAYAANKTHICEQDADAPDTPPANPGEQPAQSQPKPQ